MGEGTSQPRIDKLTAQLRPHPEPNNTPYGKLISIEFLKFSGDDMKDWVYSVNTLVWYQQYVNKYPDNTLWEHFEIEVVKSKTYGLATMQEATNTILKPRYNTPLIHTPKQSTTTYVSVAMTTRVKSNSIGQSSRYVTRNEVHNPYRLTQRELEDKRAKVSAFIMTKNGDDETYQDCMSDMVGVTDSLQITFNALFGLNSYQTMRVRGTVGKQVVHILSDYGSTHNFLDIHTAKKLGCRL
nr:retrotransposable element Tf2 [Tanacetum cinerariifolium]